MGAGTSTTNLGTQPTAATQPTSVANSFLNNSAISNGASVPSSTGSAFSQLASAGSLPGLTGSLIGNSGMMPMPPAWKPQSYVPPVPVASAAGAAKIDPHVNQAYMRNFSSTGAGQGVKLADEMKKGYFLPGGPKAAGGR